MWDMSADPFEADLAGLFLQPTGEADASRLKMRVLERLERDERRRRVVITAGAGVGAAIAGGVLFGPGPGGAAVAALIGHAASLRLPQLVVDAGGQTNLWLAAVVVLAFGGVFATRAMRSL